MRFDGTGILKDEECVVMILEELLERILYRDAMMLVLNKPAGIAVHYQTHRRWHTALMLLPVVVLF